ncbi:hypothetical protein [Thermorudis peleae]|uniref:hypothetical protein n=1 Tax=Thermorudis peleae TaxID=1382356 RepID=UPI00056DFBBE|nr:hypothetical protein [Thermorudis peleae]MBX6754873.1 hypothetical protein [Thermorudis peleae]
MTIKELTTADWQHVSAALTALWVLLTLVVLFAACFIVSYVLIPSLVSTRDLPRRATAVRPIFLILALLFAAGAIATFVVFVTRIGFLWNLWPATWY